MNKLELKNFLLSTIDIFVDNEYLDLYIKLILKNEKTVRSKFKTNQHHIIPKCILNFFNIKHISNKDNMVTLSIKDHILCHYYLCLFCKHDTAIYYKLLCALSILVYGTSTKYNTVVDDFKKLDLDNLESLYTEKNILLSQKMIGNSFAKGYKWTEERKQQHRTQRLGVNLSEGAKLKISEKSLGRRWMFKNGFYQSVPKENITVFLNEGWIFKGIPCSEKHREQISVKNKGKKRTEESKKKMSGKKAGKPSWNKGIPMSDSTKEKLSKALKGKVKNREYKPLSEETKKKISEKKKGCPVWNKGIPCSDEQKQKLKQTNIGKKQSVDTINKRILTMKNKSNEEKEIMNQKKSKAWSKKSDDEKKQIIEKRRLKTIETWKKKRLLKENIAS